MVEGFFAAKEGPAVFKHAVLKRYVRGYFNKTGSVSPGRGGFYLDAYAGPGTYEDEEPGSPAVALEALEPLRDIRNVKCAFVEENAAMFTGLYRLCSQPEFEHAIALKGRVEDHIDELLEQADGLPLLAFFDPFGMGLPLPTLQRVLARPQRGRRAAPTELLINVSRPGLYRNAGKLDSQAANESVRRAHERTVKRLCDHLGGDWWQPIWLSQDQDRIDRIIAGYLERLVPPGWRTYNVPVSADWQGDPRYHLVLLTCHDDGVWLFNECVSLALENFHDWCHREQLSLETPEVRAAAWQEQIAANTRRLLADTGAFVIVEQLRELLGEALGYARTKHIRAALRQLHGEGVVADPPKGHLQRFTVRPGPAVPQ